MILRKLVLNNFRQFAGHYTVAFAPPGSSNVTVILGDNGSGKSTLLNAFRWCLYGQIEMENPEELLSHYAVYQATIDELIPVEVELTFSHDGARYVIQRIKQYRKKDGGAIEPEGEDSVRITKVQQDGVTTTIRDAKGFIANLLPQHLARFFFFQGESILQLALQRSRDELKDGVETFLDFKVLDRAVKHLQAIEDSFDADLRREATGDVKRLQEEIDEIKAAIHGHRESLEENDANRKSIQSEQEQVTQRLSEVERFQPLLAKVDSLGTQLDGLRLRRNDVLNRLTDLISSDGFFAFSQPIVRTPRELAEAAVEKGELPSKIKPAFVSDLLESGTCICNRAIDEEARHALEKWKKKGGVADLEESIAGLRRIVIKYKNERMDPFADRLGACRDQLAEIDEAVRHAQEERSAVQREVEELDIEEVQIRELQKRYQELGEQLVDAKVRIRRAQDHIDEKQEVLDAKTKARNERMANGCFVGQLDLAGESSTRVVDVLDLHDLSPCSYRNVCEKGTGHGPKGLSAGSIDAHALEPVLMF